MLKNKNKEGYGYVGQVSSYEVKILMSDIPSDIEIKKDAIINNMTTCRVIGRHKKDTLEQIKSLHNVDCRFPHSNFPDNFFGINQESLIWK